VAESLADHPRNRRPAVPAVPRPPGRAVLALEFVDRREGRSAPVTPVRAVHEPSLTAVGNKLSRGRLPAPGARWTTTTARRGHRGGPSGVREAGRSEPTTRSERLAGEAPRTDSRPSPRTPARTTAASSATGRTGSPRGKSQWRSMSGSRRRRSGARETTTVGVDRQPVD